MNSKRELLAIIDYLEHRDSQFSENRPIDLENLEGIIIRVLIDLHRKNRPSHLDSGPVNALEKVASSGNKYMNETLLAKEIVERYFSGSKLTVLGQMKFPQFLGLLHQCLLEKNNLRKKGGTYYTPEIIVKYMSQKTIEPFLDEALNKLKTYGQSKEVTLFVQTLKKVMCYKVIDPACGSGAFLVHIFVRILGFYSEAKVLASRMGFESEVSRITGEFPAIQIIKNNLRGIDLDPDAVHLTRLALFYHAMDHSGGRYTKLTSVLKEAVIVGNSLTEDICAGEKFDLVIGNPPYIANKSLPKEVKETISKRFSTTKGQYDSIVPFIEAGIELLKDKGELCFITSNKFLAADYGWEIRKFLLEKTELRELIDLSPQKIFPDASAYPVIMLVKKMVPYNNKVKIKMGKLKVNIPQRFFLSLGNSVITTNLTEETLPIIRQIQSWSGRIEGKRIFCGIAATGFNKEITEIPETGARKIIVAGDIERYRLINTDRYIRGGVLRPRQEKSFSTPKIVLPGISKDLKAAVDLDGRALGRVYYIPSQSNLKELTRWQSYLLALYNSAVLGFFYKTLYWSVHLSGGYLRINGSYLATLPIPYWTEDSLVENQLVSEIIELSHKLTSSNNKPLNVESEDRLEANVFNLYGLSYKEASMILKKLCFDDKRVEQIILYMKNGVKIGEREANKFRSQI